MFVIGTNAKKNYLKRLERKKTFYSKNLMFQDLTRFGLAMLQSLNLSTRKSSCA